MKLSTLTGAGVAICMGLAAAPCLGQGVHDTDSPSARDRVAGKAAAAPPAAARDTEAAEEAAAGETRYVHVVQDTVKDGQLAEYEALQAERARVLSAAKWPWVEIGLRPLTGHSFELLRVSFFSSFEQLGRERAQLDANPGLAHRLADIDAKEAALLADKVEYNARYRAPISYHGVFNWADMRFMSIIKIHLRPGHGEEYEENREIVIKAHNDAALVENLAVYSINSGVLSASFRIFRPVTSMKGFDDMDSMHGERYEKILGKENQKKLVSLFGQSVETEEEEYYALDSRLSYVTPEFAGANAGFWQPAK